jgi:hypothetical protein
MRTAPALLIALVAIEARAEEESPPAPPPDQASGIARDERPPVGRRLLWIPRAILFLPRWAVWGVAQPVRGAAFAYEQYDVPGRWHDTFYTDGGGFGIYPTASYETGFGFTAGGRLVLQDMFGRGERIKARARFGGRFRQAYSVDVKSGHRIPNAALEVGASYEQRPHERTWGIGNDADLERRFEQDLIRGFGAAEFPLAGDLGARMSAALMLHSLPEHDVRNLRFETALIYDSRRPTSRFASRVIDATGWLVCVYAGGTKGIDGDPSAFTSYGGEVQRHIDLYQGTRVLALRVLVEAIDDSVVSFIDLPRLGGTELLRGYPFGRFRDRALALATAEYTWDLGNFLAAYLFVDVGRVYPSLSELALEDLRMGYGGGVQLHSTTSYLGRVQLAASREGDVLLELVLAPAFRRRERVGRY